MSSNGPDKRGKLTDCSQSDDVLTLQLVVHQTEILPGVLQPHPGHGEVEVLLVDVVPGVLLTARPPSSRELDQRLLPLLTPAGSPAPPLQQEDVGVLRHVAAPDGDGGVRGGPEGGHHGAGPD